MAEETNAHARGAKQERSVADAPIALENLCYLLHLDVRETAKNYGLSHDEVMLELWKLLLFDFFEGGTKSHDIHEVVRLVYAHYKQTL